ncbi:interleukin 12 receptor, beta 2a, like [Labeo rohita]|uniref:interleukin 12 receptor, beta 2a, like n=1 Tax=Labeo rohita TaxID=84645 RepID=UPI0021E1FC00|nr:interleukin 12 receptor, beta 2a, like [Labeo rohita]
MAWQNVKMHFALILYMWICSQASCEVGVNCWWNRALSVGGNVSLFCQTSTWGRASSCGLCQLVIKLGHRPQFASACASTDETFNFSIATEQREKILCTCSGNTSDACTVIVRGGYPPSAPSRPDCAIEDMDKEHIYCSWTKFNETMIPTVYTLHWKDYDGNVQSRESNSESALIDREEYIKGTYITAWVTAKNVLGSAQSGMSQFNTDHIIRPDPPYNLSLTSTPLEFIWEMDCDDVGPLDKSCQGQYSTHNNMLNWTEVDDCNFMCVLVDPQPFTQYNFRVRCHCGYEEKVMSNWSQVYSVRTPPAAPVGHLDVWSDCAPNSDKSSCNIYWKEMPLSQARGEIINYIVTVKLKNGTEVKQVNRQRRDTGSQHPTEQSCLQLKLSPGVTEVFVSANTSMGTSDPAFMPFAVRGQTTPKVNLSVIGENQTLRVSWSVHPQFSESVLEYVVQHVPVVSHHRCLNWVRVNRAQRSVKLTGDFKNYTAYNVSLFAVFNNHSIFLKSATAYTLEGVPPKVSQIHVKNISSSSATLIWSPIPVHESNGVILHYIVGITETGSNIRSNGTRVQLSELQPAQQYEAWVRAVSAAGEGDRTITTFSTNKKDRNVATILLAVFIPVFMLLVLIWVFTVVCKSAWCFMKIPDPINSKTFKHMNFQHTLPLLCSPSELSLKISELEIVENPDPDTPTLPSDTESDKILIDVEPQHFQVPNGLGRTNEGGERPEEEPEKLNRGNILKQDSWEKEYSEMVDTDDEKGVGDDEDWWDRQCVSDYERHFLPSVEVN